MFSDQPVTPLHVESILSFVRTYASKRSFTRDAVKDSFQPASVTPNQTQSLEALKAAIEIELVSESEDKVITPNKALTGQLAIDECLKAALDEKVLGTLDVEPYFALFYSFMLGRDQNAFGKTRDEWAIDFNREVFDNKLPSNKFNSTKVSGLHRWFSYMGLGWYDQSGDFNCNPFSRVARRLPILFGQKKKLESDAFFSALSVACPELDGGEIFLQANRRYEPSAKQCSLGLSHALIDLHYNQLIILHCPKDSAGWSIAIAGPPSDGKTLIGDRISQVELVKGV
jgi:hypothetical protein